MKIEKDPLNLIIAGVGGQGNVLASHIIAYAGIQDGFFVTVGETYGASQRGGSVMSHVRLSSITQRGPLVPEGQADVIMGLEPAETLRVIADFGNPNTRVIMNPRPVYPIWVLSGLAEYPSVEDIINRLEKLAKGVNVIKEAQKEDGARVANVLMVGALVGSGLLPIGIESFKDAIRKVVPEKAVSMNLTAFKNGTASTGDV